MKITKSSKELISFLIKNNHVNSVTQNKKTDAIISKLYNDILESYNYLYSLKQSKGDFYNITVKKIQSSFEIVKPKNFNANSFPEEVRKHIDEMSMSEISYTFSLFDRNIKIIFITEEDNETLKIDTYNNYVDTIIIWLYILNEYASKQCSSNIIVYFYFTSLKKILPSSHISILDEINVNTAFTTTCPKDSEIVVFRKEEWFKVFIHETFHNFGLDFSDMDISESTKHILTIFPVNSDVNLYESYTEFWAEIINALFCSFTILKNKNNIDEFLYNFDYFISLERTYSFFQMVKVLNFMGLTYKDLYTPNIHSKTRRDTLYKEESNVLSYYIIKTVLINNYQGFLNWCKVNNLSLLQFKKTPSNQKEFCKFIEKNYKTQSMIDGVNDSQDFLKNYKKNINNKFISKNLRMTVCELG
jgi:hypothetical protein